MRLGLGLGLEVGYNPQLFQSSTNLLLDSITGAEAAFSLRQLIPSATNVILVQRSSDNAELAFNATEIIDGTLTTWVGAGNTGYIKTWYDQSGNGNDITQTTQSDMPIIVSSGSLVTVNSLPAIEFNGTSSILTRAPLSLDGDTSFSSIAVVQNDGGGGIIYTNDIAGNSYFFGLTSNSSNEHGGFLSSSTSGGTIDFSGTATTSQLLMYVDFLQTSASYYENSSIQTGTNGLISIAASTFDVGARKNVLYYDGKIQEIIIWSSAKTGNRSEIESNVNTYYSIY